jgi:hypothetical protein
MLLTLVSRRQTIGQWVWIRASEETLAHTAFMPAMG